MKKTSEAMGTEMEGGTDAAGQAAEQPEAGLEAQKEALQNASENSSEQAIGATIGERDRVDQEIFAAQKSIAERQAKLSSLREEMGMPSGNENSPVADFQNERIKELEKRKGELDQQKENWIKQYGRENLPDGLAFDGENGDREAKGGSVEKNRDREQEEKEKKEDLEFRKKWMEKFKEDSVKNFEEAMREDWHTNDAMNLDLTVELMKRRVPSAMDKEAEDFINGKVDGPPFSTVWIKWQTSSALDKILGKPNFISKLEITFDNDAQKLAEESELKEEENKEVKKEDSAPSVNSAS